MELQILIISYVPYTQFITFGVLITISFSATTGKRSIASRANSCFSTRAVSAIPSSDSLTFGRVRSCRGVVGNRRPPGIPGNRVLSKGQPGEPASILTCSTQTERKEMQILSRKFVILQF